MSILRKESRWKLMAPSSTSGAMYRLVPTWRDKACNNEWWFGRVLMQLCALSKGRVRKQPTLATIRWHAAMPAGDTPRSVLYPLGTRTRRTWSSAARFSSLRGLFCKKESETFRVPLLHCRAPPVFPFYAPQVFLQARPEFLKVNLWHHESVFCYCPGAILLSTVVGMVWTENRSSRD